MSQTATPPGTVKRESPVYVIGDHRGQEYIWCRTCGMASYNANDVRERYCGRCHRFHLEPTPEHAAQARAALEKQERGGR